MCLVAVLAQDRAIGKDGGLLFRLPEDLKRFKALTTGHAVIMGRKTFDSIGRALPNRRNIVVSRATPTLPEGVELARSLDDAIERAREGDDEPMVIGGGDIYRLAMPLATRLEISWVNQLVEGADTFFPAIDPAVFAQVSEESAATPNLRFVGYRRVSRE